MGRRHAEEDFIKGFVEVQDEGSQLAALFSAAKPGEQVIDLCAGAGGKTLALAAMMGGKGRLIATDYDKRQLAPIHAIAWSPLNTGWKKVAQKSLG